MSYVTQDMCRNLCIPLATEIYGNLETPEKSEVNTGEDIGSQQNSKLYAGTSEKNTCGKLSKQAC
jgi:hypothetical protein